MAARSKPQLPYIGFGASTASAEVQTRARAAAPAKVRFISSTPLPELHALIGRQVVRIAGLHIRERGVPAIVIADDAIDAIERRAVRIGQHHLAGARVAPQLAPALTVSEVEALVAGEAVQHRRRLAAERDVIGL